jgi:3D (Asp-Asp-Asp) domain-containing protein
MFILKRKDVICVFIAVMMMLSVPMTALAAEPDADTGTDVSALNETAAAEENSAEALTPVPEPAPAEETPATEQVTAEPAAEAAVAAAEADTDDAAVVTKQKSVQIEVKAKADGRSRIKVSWQKVQLSAGYAVYRSASEKKRGMKVYTASKASVTRFTDKKAAINKKYYYTVVPREDRQLLKSSSAGTLSVTAGKSDAVRNKLNTKRAFKVKAYAYSGGGHTASGKRAQVGRVAVDPRVIKLGTWLYIEGYGLAQACDTGGNIKGKTLDLYMNSNSECYRWGVRYPKVYVLK